MNFLEFQKLFEGYPVISIQEIEKAAPGFNPRNLGNWQAKGYLKKIRNGWYAVAGQQASEPLLFAIANQIYTPSYVSLESALSWHGFIPEGVFITTSVSSRKTQAFEGELGKFTYQSLQPAQMFGFRLVEAGDWRFKIAEPEKVLLDFLHLRPEYDSPEAVEGLRLNPFTVSQLDWVKMSRYASSFQNKALLKRLKNVTTVHKVPASFNR